MAEPTATSYLVAHLASTLTGFGRDPTQALDETAIDQSLLVDPDTRLPVSTLFRFWRLAATAAVDPLFGLKTAENVSEGYPVFRYLLRNSPTLNEAYQRWSRFYGIISDAAKVTFTRDGQIGTLICEPMTSDSMPAIGEDWTVGQWLTLGRLLTGRDWSPNKVWLVHSDFGLEDRYREWFGTNVVFDADRSAMSIPATVLDFGVTGADKTLLTILDQHVATIFEALPSAPTTASALRTVVSKRLTEGRPTMTGVASELAISERTLQRRLKAEGTNLRTVFAEVRQQTAEATLADPGISLTETAFLLGFSEPSAFHRAFKQWTGLTPSAYRVQKLRKLSIGANSQ